MITSRVSSADHCARIGYPTLRLPAQIAQIRIAGDDPVRSTLAAHDGGSERPLSRLAVTQRDDFSDGGLGARPLPTRRVWLVC
jgi:hypothetical protein